MKKLEPTMNQFQAYQGLFNYFNKHLFESKLPQVILNFSRKAKTYGFFAPKRWSSGRWSRHEISVNPESLMRPAIETCATLVHEMCHLWQQEFGSPSRTGYHNKEWAAKMLEVGLNPDNGKGGVTGQSVSHNISAVGKFRNKFNPMPSHMKLPFHCLPEPDNKKKAKAKVTYECIECGTKAWGKPGLDIYHVEPGSAKFVRMAEID